MEEILPVLAKTINVFRSLRVRCGLAATFAALLCSAPAARADWPLNAGGIPRLTPAASMNSSAGLRLPPLAPAFGMPSPRSQLAVGGAPGLQCRQAIRVAERAARIPDQLMAAIGRIESGRPDSAGVVHPWPWTINAEGIGSYFQSKAEALAAVRALQARGVKSIDVGCMQVNMMFHPDAFASLEQAFDPAANAAYAARFLNQLFVQTGNWTKATAFYHSGTPELGDGYQRKVAAVLPEEQKRLRDTPGLGGNVWSVSAFTANAWNSSGITRPATGGTGGLTLSSRADQGRLLPAMSGVTGRGLDAYRGVPVPLAARAGGLLAARAPL